MQQIRYLKRLVAVTAIMLPIALIGSFGCSGHQNVPVRGSAVRVAKVDTEYVYEANVSEYVSTFRESRRNRISTFVGFTPDDILRAREEAIDSQIRKEIGRLPGVSILNSEVTELANEQVEELAWELHRQITEEGVSFEVIAFEYSEGVTATEGGAMQPFGIVRTPEPYQNHTYSMEIGDLGEPFKSWDGWRIIRLDNITEDPLAGTQYQISMIHLKPDTIRARATIIDGLAVGHAIEYLDPKYNALRALMDENNDLALTHAELAVRRDDEDDLAHYLMSRALWGLDRRDEAVESLQLAAEVGTISDALIPYYHFYRGQYLEELDRNNEALEAYHESFDTWRQDVNLAFILKAVFERLGDQEYLELIDEEIRVIAEQDALAVAMGSRTSGGSVGGVIVTGEGEVHDTSSVYEPGYQE